MSKFLTSLIALFFSFSVFAVNVKVGANAPLFKLRDQFGNEFNLADQKGKWTVLYFYPKAETPGCTKQACAFRDNIKKITALGANVYGVSINSVNDQLQFTNKHQINFPLLADEKGDITKLYGTKMPLLNMSKRWTFIVGPDLKVKDISKDVDPILDAQRVAQKITDLQKQ